MNGAQLLPEFDQESAATRKTLERLPEDKFDWRPHDKSWTLHELAAHLTNIASWTGPTFEMDELDLAQPMERDVPDTLDGLLAEFDANVAEARSKLAATTEDQFGEMWTLKMGDEVLFSMPKGAVLRSFVLNHAVHHRAQLGVYLRMLDVEVPGPYGPSADEA